MLDEFPRPDDQPEDVSCETTSAWSSKIIHVKQRPKLSTLIRKAEVQAIDHLLARNERAMIAYHRPGNSALRAALIMRVLTKLQSRIRKEFAEIDRRSP